MGNCVLSRGFFVGVLLPIFSVVALCERSFSFPVDIVPPFVCDAFFWRGLSIF
jgi:hypothetical protein